MTSGKGSSAASSLSSRMCAPCVRYSPQGGEPRYLNTVQAVAAELTAVLAARWEDATLASLADFGTLAEQIDARLLRFTPELFEEIQAGSRLVQWYRLTPDDQNFTTSVEMAMGRSQMESPDALWNHEQHCVDEGKLSLLSSVRAYLHEHLFGSGETDARLASIRAHSGEVHEHAGSSGMPSPPPPPTTTTTEGYTYTALLDVFSRLDWRQASSIADALRACSPLTSAFIGLMGSDADAAAPHRLTALQGSQTRARFWCSSVPPGAQLSGGHGLAAGPQRASSATEVTTSASEDGSMMLITARSLSRSTSIHSNSSNGAVESHDGAAPAGRPMHLEVDAGVLRQPYVWLEYMV